MRIGFNEVSFASPEAARQIYSVGQGFDKTEAYSVYPPPENPDIFTEADEAKHAIKRRMVSNAYSHKSIVDMEQFVDKTEERLFHKLDELFIENGQTECDLGSWLEFYAFDVRPIHPYRCLLYCRDYLWYQGQKSGCVLAADRDITRCNR